MAESFPKFMKSLPIKITSFMVLLVSRPMLINNSPRDWEKRIQMELLEYFNLNKIDIKKWELSGNKFFDDNDSSIAQLIVLLFFYIHSKFVDFILKSFISCSMISKNLMEAMLFPIFLGSVKHDLVPLHFRYPNNSRYGFWKRFSIWEIFHFEMSHRNFIFFQEMNCRVFEIIFLLSQGMFSITFEQQISIHVHYSFHIAETVIKNLEL